MQFCEKLDFLMKITNTTNSALLMYVNLDASHISRLRRGKRNALKDEACIRSMAEYFTRHCTNDYQRKSVADALKINFFTLDGSKIPELITQWLIDGEKSEAKIVEMFLTGFSSASEKPKTPAANDSLSTEFPKTDSNIYYGVEGKRQAVIYFLSEVLAQSKLRTLLLFSDEPTDWMTVDREFAAKWAILMTQMLAKGNKIKIIHTVSRDLDEMLNAISQWMPLYMSGMIEPYYYPKKRDGIFNRTLFIAPDIVAVVSSSVGSMTNKAANLLFRNRNAIDAFTEEFNQYLSLCKPLMRVFTSLDKEAYFHTLLEFEKEKSDSIIKTESLSLLTMPKTVISNILIRIGRIESNIAEIQKSRMKNFGKILQTNSFTEIINIFDNETVNNGKVKVAFSDMLDGGVAYYTLEEYILHLENIQCMLNVYHNFHVCFIENAVENQYMIYAKEDTGAIVAKTSVPTVALAINENNMTAAFWDYLRTMIGEKAFRNPNNKETAGKLANYIEQLKQSLR